MFAGKQLANAAVSLTPDSAVDTDAAGKAAKMHSTRPGRGADGNTAGKLADMQDKEGAVSTQQALDLLDAKDAQTGFVAVLILQHRQWLVVVCCQHWLWH